MEEKYGEDARIMKYATTDKDRGTLKACNKEGYETFVIPRMMILVDIFLPVVLSWIICPL